MSTLLGLLALVLAVLGAVIYVAYVYSVSVDGSYSLNLSVSGGTVEGVLIELPRDEGGELVYRVRDFTAVVAHGGVSEEVAPVFSDFVGDYPGLIEIPYTFGEGDYLISGDFSLDPIMGVDYGAYPWKLVVGGEQFHAYPAIKESLGFRLILLIKEYRLPIIAGLSALAAGLGAASLTILFRGTVFQERPATPPAPPKKGCESWCTLCVRLFRVSTEERGGSRLPRRYVEPFLRLLNYVNKIWRKCCIRLYPCLENGRVIAEYIDPRREVVVEVFRNTAGVGGAGIVYRVVRRLRASDIFSDERCTTLRARDGRVKIPYTEFVEAWWGSDGVYGGGRHRKGERLGPEELRRFLDDVASRLEDESKRADVSRVKSLIEPKRGEGEVEVTRVLEALAEVCGHPRRCIDVFVVGRYEEVGKARVRGFASTPGRTIVISSSVVEYGMGEILAHEVGHNLSLKHVNEPGNLMEPAITGKELSKEQCEAAGKNCRSVKERLHDPRTCGDGGKMLEDVKTKELLDEKLRNERSRLEKLKEVLKNLSNKSRECRKSRGDLWGRYKDVEFVYTHVRGFCREVEELKKRNKKEKLNKEREDVLEKLGKWRKTDPTGRWARVYEEKLKAIDGDPKAVADALKAKMERLRREYELCKRYADHPKEVEKELKEEIANTKNEIQKLENALKGAEKRLRAYLGEEGR